MTTAAAQRDALMPQRADGIGRGFAIAALVHIGLIVALAFGVSWRSHDDAGVEAELWAAVPTVAAQRAVEPTPTPPPPKPTPKVEPKPEPKPEPAPPPKVQAPDPQIAIEKAKQEKLKKEKQKREDEAAEKKELEKKKAEDKAKADKTEKAEADKRKKEEAQRSAALDAQREANIKRILGDANATGNSPGTAARTAGPSAGYAGRIKAQIRPNITFTDNIDGNPMAEVEVRCGPDGSIITSKLVKSSGVKEWDDAVLRALDKTEKLPRDTDGSVPSPMLLVFRPKDF